MPHSTWTGNCRFLRCIAWCKNVRDLFWPCEDQTGQRWPFRRSTLTSCMRAFSLCILGILTKTPSFLGGGGGGLISAVERGGLECCWRVRVKGAVPLLSSLPLHPDRRVQQGGSDLAYSRSLGMTAISKQTKRSRNKKATRSSQIVPRLFSHKLSEFRMRFSACEGSIFGVALRWRLMTAHPETDHFPLLWAPCRILQHLSRINPRKQVTVVPWKIWLAVLSAIHFHASGPLGFLRLLESAKGRK